ncbi:MAG TPA: cytochrome P450 [Xanthobacteraceae bacterium]|nr:cytochrome P450 [Xanthobacteraceae bacterium]
MQWELPGDGEAVGAASHNDALTTFSYRPPAPTPQPKPLNFLRLISTLKRNPLECWTQEHFEKPIVAGGLPFKHVLLVHEPRAIRRVLLDNAANYQKDSIQRRVLSAGLGDGLLSAESERWRTQRRTVAPVFARKTIMSFAPAMMGAATALTERWRGKDGATVDIAAEMTRVTLDVLERTIFSDGFGREAEDIRKAMNTYFNTIGRIDPLDLIGLPPSVPRISHLRVRSTLRFFESAIDQIIATRRQRIAEHSEAGANDILTLLLDALDPDTGQRMSEAEVRSNILTFIAAGHETTANTISWSLFLLSQSPQWRARVAAEAAREIGGPIEGLADRLVETRAVIDEAIRLYPPIAAISRVANGPDELAGERVKRGTLIVIATYVLHRHQQYWRNPDAFDPSRFLGEARAAIDRFAYIPFGAGLRTCIGSAFALQEATLILATIIKNFSLRLAAGHDVWPLLRVTLRPAGGLPMTIRSKPTSRPR